jgi:hypothetical protein
VPKGDAVLTDTPHDDKAVAEASAVDSAQTTGEVAGRDGGPHDSGDVAAAEGLSADPDVAENYSDIVAKAAATRGEGRVP